MLCLHILQGSLGLINTLMIQDTLALPEWAGVLTDADRRGLTPVFLTNMIPYGERSGYGPTAAWTSRASPRPRPDPGVGWLAGPWRRSPRAARRLPSPARAGAGPQARIATGSCQRVTNINGGRGNGGTHPCGQPGQRCTLLCMSQIHKRKEACERSRPRARTESSGPGPGCDPDPRPHHTDLNRRPE